MPIVVRESQIIHKIIITNITSTNGLNRLALLTIMSCIYLPGDNS
ncbi:MAG: hypothetical protein TECD_01080 [Hyphomicrobiaceae bacterium hypho_1]